MNVDGDEIAAELERAAKNPDLRAAFLQLLLRTEIYAATGKSRHELRVIEDATGQSFIPFFSSRNGMNAFFTGEMPYLRIPTRVLFEAKPDAHFVINPGSATGKTFTPEEVHSLLAYGVSAAEGAVIMDAKQPMYIGAPAEPPHALNAAFATYLASQPVASAFCLQIINPEQEKTPHLAYALEHTGDPAQTIPAVIEWLRAHLPPTQMVDLLHVRRGEDGTSKHVFETFTPFYERKR